MRHLHQMDEVIGKYVHVDASLQQEGLLGSAS